MMIESIEWTFLNSFLPEDRTRETPSFGQNSEIF